MIRFLIDLQKIVGINHSELMTLIRQIVDFLLECYIYNVGSLTDGSIIKLDCRSMGQVKGFLNTVQATPTLQISNFKTLVSLVVKPNITTTITLSGTGLKFVDMDNLASPADTIDLVCGNTYNEISINDSGDVDGTSKVLLVVKK